MILHSVSDPLLVQNCSAGQPQWETMRLARRDITASRIMSPSWLSLATRISGWPHPHPSLLIIRTAVTKNGQWKQPQILALSARVAAGTSIYLCLSFYVCKWGGLMAVPWPCTCFCNWDDACKVLSLKSLHNLQSVSQGQAWFMGPTSPTTTGLSEHCSIHIVHDMAPGTEAKLSLCSRDHGAHKAYPIYYLGPCKKNFSKPCNKW